MSRDSHNPNPLVERTRALVARRHRPRCAELTAADYIVPAICLVLIVGLVESVNLFLLETIGQGPTLEADRWVLFWFLFGAVLISRIAIEINPPAAIHYTVALVLAMLLRAQWTWFVWIVLLGSWWVGHRLVRACAEIEEVVPEEGLIQRAASFWKERVWRTELPPADRPSMPLPPGTLLGIFSAVAFLVFGAGERALPRGENLLPLGLLALFCFASLGLLLAFSFLQTRHYFRQYDLRISAALARAWFWRGLKIIAALLVVGFLLPRPGVERDWELAFHRPPASQPQRADSPDARPTSLPAIGGNRQLVHSSGGAVPQTRAPRTPRMLTWIGCAAGMAILLFFLIKNRSGLASLWRALAARGRKRSTSRLSMPAASDLSVLPPEKFMNPFESGASEDLSDFELICYSFAALEAAAARTGCPRAAFETAFEFGQRLLEKNPVLSEAAEPLIDLRIRCAYSNQAVPSEARDTVFQFWQCLDQLS